MINNISPLLKLDRVKGDIHPNSKLKSQDIKKIRSMYSTGIYSHSDLGKLYGVGRRHIGDIINRKSWEHIK